MMLSALLFSAMTTWPSHDMTVATPDIREPYRQMAGMTSLTAQRFQYLVKQKTDFSCGAAAVATILSQAYDWPVNEYDVISGMLLDADLDLVIEKGFSMLDMKHYVKRLGLRARGYKVDANTLKKIKIPTIVLLDINNYKHFVVLQRIEGDRVYIGDPARGNMTLAFPTFVKAWNGFVLGIIGPGYDRNNPLVTRAGPLTLANKHQQQRLISDHELMEFGFTQSDLF